MKTNENFLSKLKGIKGCAKCHGEGSYMYDDIHGKICEDCCIHPLGFIQLNPEIYGESMRDNEICMYGCGFMRPKKNKGK
jgi:hypothetical protein